MGSFDRVIHVFFLDTHGGRSVALIPRGTRLIDLHGNTWYPSLGASNRKSCKIYERGIRNVLDLAAGDPIIAIHNGDFTHGDEHKDSELISTRNDDHVVIACADMGCLLAQEEVQEMILLSGTGVHELGQGTATELTAKILQGRYPDKRILHRGHARLQHGSLIFDVAHHGPSPGIRDWTSGDVLRYYTKPLMLSDLNHDSVPPDIVLRAHYHEYARGTVTIRRHGMIFETLALILPSYSFIGDYVRKIVRSPGWVTLGMIAVEVINGRVHHVYDQEPDFMETLDLRQEVDVLDVTA